VYISSDGLLTDLDLINNGLTVDPFDSDGYVSFVFDSSQTLDNDGGVICKEDKCKTFVFLHTKPLHVPIYLSK